METTKAESGPDVPDNDWKERFEAFWREHPEDIAPERYLEGFPVPVSVSEDGKIHFTWRPWGRHADMGPFAKAAAQALAETCEHPFPLTVCAFGLHLRRVSVLLSLGLPDDPESVNVVRGVEAITEGLITVKELREKVAGLVVSANASGMRKYDPEKDAETLKKYLAGKAFYYDNMGGGALPLHFTPAEENDGQKDPDRAPDRADGHASL